MVCEGGYTDKGLINECVTKTIGQNEEMKRFH